MRIKNIQLSSQSYVRPEIKIKPAVSYIHRNKDLVMIQTRVLPEVKQQAEDAAAKLDTSLNRFVEAALKWYLEELKREGSL